MLQIEIIRCEASAIIHYLAEVVHATLNMEHILLWYSRPQRSQNEVRIVYAHHLIIIIAHILTYHPLPTVATCCYVAIAVELVITRY